jgi:hypothetical protein
MNHLKRLNWKVAAGGALAGVAMGGIAAAAGGTPNVPPVTNVQLTPTAPASAMPNGPLASPNSEIVVTQTPAVAPLVVTEVPAQVVPAPVVLAPVVLAPVELPPDVVAPVDTSNSVSVASVSVASVASVSVDNLD